MNRILIPVLLSLILLAMPARSQMLSIYGNINNTTFDGDRPQEFKIQANFGYNVGLMYDQTVAEGVDLSFAPGLVFYNMNILTKDNGNPDRKFKDSLEFKLRYVDLPLMTKIYFKNNKLYMKTGLVFSLLWEAEIFTLEGSSAGDIKDNFDSWNLSWVLGIGYRFPVRHNFIFVELMYQQGLVNITEFNNPDDYFARVKLVGGQWSVGYTLNFKKDK